MMKENNQEMLQQYCDNNDQTNMALVIMVYQNTAPKMMCCSTNMDNKGHRVIIGGCTISTLKKSATKIFLTALGGKLISSWQ